MAVSATEYLEFAARSHTCVHVHLNRYVVTAYGYLVAVFDTVSKTSRAFDMTPLGITTVGRGNVFSWSGRLFVVGTASNVWYLVEIDLGSGAASVSSSLANAGGTNAMATVVGDLVWISGNARSGWIDLSTMAAGTLVAAAQTFVAGNVVYRESSTSRWNASTGAALAAGSGTAPGASDYTRPVTVSGVVHYTTSSLPGTILRWDTSTETSLSSVANGCYGAMTLASDGLLWSTDAVGIRAYNPATVGTRTDTWPTSRSERVGIVEVDGKMWAPSGYPT